MEKYHHTLGLRSPNLRRIKNQKREREREKWWISHETHLLVDFLSCFTHLLVDFLSCFSLFSEVGISSYPKSMIIFLLSMVEPLLGLVSPSAVVGGLMHPKENRELTSLSISHPLNASKHLISQERQRPSTFFFFKRISTFTFGFQIQSPS